MFKRILLVVVLLVIVLLVVGLFLPANYHVERTIVINAKPEVVFPYFNNLKKWPEWCAWTKEKDPTLMYTYTGPEEGVGATWTWEGKKMGTGTMTTTASDWRTGTKYDLSFEHDKYKSKGGITMEPAADGTRLVWVDDGDLGVNPVHRYFGLFMDKMIGPDFEDGLQKLKQKAEQQAK